MVEFGLWLKRKRKRLQPKVSQNDIGRHMNWENGQLCSNWERGEQTPPILTIFKLADFLQIPHEIMMQRFLQFKRRQLLELAATQKGLNEQSLPMRSNRKRS